MNAEQTPEVLRNQKEQLKREIEENSSQFKEIDKISIYKQLIGDRVDISHLQT